MRVTNKNGYNFLNIVLQNGRVTQNINLNLFFWRIHDSHQRFRQQTKRRSLGCWASRWAQSSGYEQSKCNYILWHIQRTCTQAHMFQRMKILRAGATDAWKLIMGSNAQVPVIGLYFSGGRSWQHNSHLITVYEPQVSKRLNGLRLSSCSASTLYWSYRLRFLWGLIIRRYIIYP